MSGFFYTCYIMQSMKDNDQLHPFIFEEHPIRGALAHLNSTFNQALENQLLPMVIKKALGELMVASALLTSTLKMDGSLVLQIQNRKAKVTSR